MGKFNQHLIIEKLNQYLKSRQRAVALQSGYCHGLVLLWLYKMSTGQEQWFYDLVQKISDCKHDEQFDAIEQDIELFISYIEWLQNSSVYEYKINQLDIDKLTELPKDLALSFLFHHSQLDSMLPFLIKNNKLISISGPSHTIGIYQKDNHTYVFDPEYDQLRPKMIDDIQLVKFEIVKCLFKRNYLPDCKLPLEIVVLSNPDTAPGKMIESNYGDISNLYANLIHECKDIDNPGLDGITNMHLACESGNENEVAQLLKNGSDPNRPCKDDWTPLLISSTRGYTPIVKLLLKFGAIATQGNKNGMKSVDLALARGHDDIVNLLSDLKPH